MALVQGAIPQDEKWQIAEREHTFALYRQLTGEAFGARLIVLPEASLPLLANDLEPYLGPLERDAEARGSTLVVGLLRYEPEADRYYNSLFALGSPRSYYDKRRLVPFRGILSRAGGGARVDAAHEPAVHRHDAGCGGAAAAARRRARNSRRPSAMRTPGAASGSAALRDAHLMVNVTNDAWFGDSTASHQHLEIARMRSLEAGRYQMRVANDGITAIIDPRGAVIARIPRFKAAVLRGSVVPYRGLDALRERRQLADRRHSVS